VARAWCSQGQADESTKHSPPSRQSLALHSHRSLVSLAVGGQRPLRPARHPAVAVVARSRASGGLRAEHSVVAAVRLALLGSHRLGAAPRTPASPTLRVSARGPAEGLEVALPPRPAASRRRTGTAFRFARNSTGRQPGSSRRHLPIGQVPARFARGCRGDSDLSSRLRTSVSLRDPKVRVARCTPDPPALREVGDSDHCPNAFPRLRETGEFGQARAPVTPLRWAGPPHDLPDRSGDDARSAARLGLRYSPDSLSPPKLDCPRRPKLRTGSARAPSTPARRSLAPPHSPPTAVSPWRRSADRR
jgi:hypothetical protein